MFAFQNLNIILNNISQMPILAKHGMFQSLSFTTIKKFPEVDVVFPESSQSFQFVRDLKYEKWLDFFARSKFEVSLQAAGWSLVDFMHEVADKRGRKTNTSYTKCKKAEVPADTFNDCRKINYATITDKKGDNSLEMLLPASETNSLDQPRLSNPSCGSATECKKSSPVMLHFVPLKNFSNQSIVKIGSLCVNPGQGTLINRNVNGLFQGQVRRFKTQSQIKLEMEQGIINRLVTLYMKKKSKPSKEIEKDDDTDSKTSEVKSARAGRGSVFVKSLADIMRLAFYGGALFLTYELFLKTTSKEFISTHCSEKVDVTFEDAKGMEEAKEELKFIVDFLRHPSKYMYLGGKLPSGILLQGAPGTGKTLLARAVAGEAGVAFFHISGSEFDEVLVGEGARRVRNLFQAARSKAPAVIFIDEIDTIGGKRVSHSMHPFANQTINQLLSEMDGFVQNDKIVVIGATNRFDDLDEALLRPGRFDLKIQLKYPDMNGRKEILKVHLNKIVTEDIDVDFLAKQTLGLSGADIENIVNQAALIAAAVGSKYVTMEHIDQAVEKVIFGPALKSRIGNREMSRITAYHESGHAIVAYFTPHSNPPVKATIVPHGKALGFTAILPDESEAHSKAELLASIDVKLGGRAAEELMFGPDMITTGCESDLIGATNLANKMVSVWGMSDKFGLRSETRGNNNKELGPTAGNDKDEEIRKILQESYERAKNILRKHSKEHKLLAETLLEKETVDADEIRAILGKREVDDSAKKNRSQ